MRCRFRVMLDTPAPASDVARPWQDDFSMHGLDQADDRQPQIEQEARRRLAASACIEGSTCEYVSCRRLLNDAAKVRTALERMPLQEGRWHAAARRALEAGIDALEGRTSEAAASYDTLLAAGDRFSQALVTLDAVAALPEALVPEGAPAAARAHLEELRADALIARLDTIARPGVHETT